MAAIGPELRAGSFKPLAVACCLVAVSGRYSSTVKKSEQAEQLLQEIVESVRVPV